MKAKLRNLYGYLFINPLPSITMKSPAPRVGGVPAVPAAAQSDPTLAWVMSSF